ncbi:MAG: hypothetical protein ABJB55_00640 [Actinomycetota bacterium]
MQQPPPHASSADASVERRRIPALLTGYWAFGQYWGIWVILVVQIQRYHDLSFSEMGLLLALLSLVAIIVMAFVAPRLARFPLGALCASGLLALGTGSLGMALLPSSMLWLAFAIAGVGNGLVDVFLDASCSVSVGARRSCCRALAGSSAARSQRWPPTPHRSPSGSC